MQNLDRAELRVHLRILKQFEKKVDIFVAGESIEETMEDKFYLLTLSKIIQKIVSPVRQKDKILINTFDFYNFV